MPVQATSVPSERIFSASKQTTTARRNRLGPKIMEAMQILKFQAKDQREEVNFTKGFSLQEEFDDLEEREAVKCTEILKEYFDGMHEEE